MVLNAVSVSFLIIYLIKLFQKCWFAFKNQHLKKKKKPKRKEKTETNKKEIKKKKVKTKKRKKSATEHALSHSTQLRDWCSSWEFVACVVYTVTDPVVVMCATGDRRGTRNFAGKNLFWYTILFALHHILFKRGIFLWRERNCVFEIRSRIRWNK